jgi:hypothetical protein
MKRKFKWTPIVIVLVAILLFNMSGEYAKMAKEVSFWDALGGFALLTLITGGIIYWIKRSKRVK